MQSSHCPVCEHENIEGSETCDECGAALTSLTDPAPDSPIESSIMSDPLTSLSPAEPVTVSPDEPLHSVVSKMVELGLGCVLVVEGQRLTGIFSERDVLLRVAERYDELRERPVSEFMTVDPELLPPDASIAYAINRMALGNYRHIPIAGEDCKLIGIVSVRDVLRYLSSWYPDIAAV